MVDDIIDNNPKFELAEEMKNNLVDADEVDEFIKNKFF